MFDRLLKGRFFQALLPKWPRKLVAPKSEETFSELYDRVRMLEKHELQYVASAAVSKDMKTTTIPIDQKGDQSKKNQQGKNKTYRAPSQTATTKEGSGSAGPAQSTAVQKSSGNNKCARAPHTGLKRHRVEESPPQQHR